MHRKAALVLIATLVLSGCSEPSVREISSIQPTMAPTTSSYSPTTLTTVWTPPVPTMTVPTITVPLANFKRMHGYKLGDQHHDASLCGWLHIHEPYVNLLEPLSPDWDPNVDFGDVNLENIDDNSLIVHWVHLPRSGTRYYPPSQSLWVWDQGPMTNGDYVCTAGSGGGGRRNNPHNIYESNPWYAPYLGPEEPLLINKEPPTFNPDQPY